MTTTVSVELPPQVFDTHASIALHCQIAVTSIRAMRATDNAPTIFFAFCVGGFAVSLPFSFGVWPRDPVTWALAVAVGDRVAPEPDPTPEFVIHAAITPTATELREQSTAVRDRQSSGPLTDAEQSQMQIDAVAAVARCSRRSSATGS